MIRLERNDAGMVRLISNSRLENRTSAEEFRTRHKLKSIRKCLLGRVQYWVGHLERMEESSWSSKCRTFKDSGSFPR